jgi:hypothetical protein
MSYRILVLSSLFIASNAIADDGLTEAAESRSSAEDTDADRGWWCPTHAVYDQCPLDELTEAELVAQEEADEEQMADDLKAAAALERAWWCPIHSAYDTHPIIDAKGW